MDRLHAMAVFVAVCEEASFSGGARRLGMSAPAVTRTIAQLEEHLGARLLHRTTRHVRATETGLSYLHDARRVLAAAEEADNAAAGLNATPRGHLTVTAPVMFGRLFVMPGIVRFLQQYPEVQVSALLVDRVVNLAEEGIDVAIRIGTLGDSGMRAIRVGSVRRILCASPAYLAAHGTPTQPADLRNHTIIAATASTDAVDWRFGPDAAAQSVPLRPRLTVTNNDAAIDAALAGLGITRLMSYQVAPFLADGRLQRLLQPAETSALPIHVLHRESRHGSAKTRCFIDLLVDHLRSEAKRDDGAITAV